jgi:D-alanine-D-alanine ligase
MRVAVCYNHTPADLHHGEARDRIAHLGAGTEARAVSDALGTLGHDAAIIPLADDLVDFIARLKAYAPEVVFNLCEGFRGNARLEMQVAGVFELLGVPFTGADALCLGLTQDKVRTKVLLQQAGVPTPAFCLARLGKKFPHIEKLVFPMIVKPAFEDASQGIDAASVVDDRKALMRRIQFVHETYRQSALVEEFIDGRELNVAIIGYRRPDALPLAEIVFDDQLPRKIVCFDSKWLPQSRAFQGTRPVCPAKLPPRDNLLVNEIALRSFTILGCRDYARVDLRLRGRSPFVLEINANPDISPDAGLARAAAAAGRSYPQLIERILACAVQRKEVAYARP